MEWLPLLPFVVLFAAMLIFGLIRRRSCPDCGSPLSVLQSPSTKTRRQWIEGGYLCQHCGCESDMSGNKVEPGTPLSYRSFVIGAGILAAAIVPAVVMLVFILRP